MKKILAILLSALMLCAMIPFATVAVAADEDYYIEIVADAEEVDAGDYVTIEVSLYGHESVGLIGAQIELGFDPDVFELETYYDEDEEMYMPPIEVGSKFNASSNKYILFPPIDEETGYMERCLVQFLRATASASQAVKTNLFYTVTFKVKDDAVSGDYTIDFINYEKTNIIQHGNKIVDWTWEPITIHVNGTDPEPEEPACEHEYNYDCDKNCSKCGEETRPEADHAYFYACDAHCMYCYEMTNPEAAHDLTHVDAVAATCTANGNVEYWTCGACGGCWDNENATGMPLNRFSIIVPAAGHVYFDDCSAICDVCGEEREVSHNVIHVEAVPATCTTEGNIEYWYCDVCGMAWLDAECTLNTNLLSVKLPASCSYGAQYVEAKEATCFEPGNVEYWYCANCDVYYADAACAIVTNAKNVIIPITHNVIHVEAKEPTCTELGNIEYWYCADCGQAWLDELCHLNTNMMAVKLAASCKYGAEYVEAKAATCYEPGNTEYWYCANCDVYYADADCTIITNAKNVIIPITHNIIAVEAKAATCTEMGNIAYWYCADCGQAWLDELCHLNTNLRAVVLPMAEHTYAGDCDTTCDACGAEREVVLPAAPVAFGGNSISENKNGLAFLFTADVDGIIINDNFKADYTNATVIINGEEHKVVGMGAILNNKGYSAQTLDDVDGQYVLNVKANKVFDDSSYAIRIVNIPAEQLDTIITARSYITYECGGELITIYGEDIATSYNAELG